MSQPDLAAFQAELLDDFYAECDEHLSNIRQQFMAVETMAAEGRLDREALDSLFRSMHSLKGNAAIVGLRSAEELAHLAEGLLRIWLRGQIPPEKNGLDLLATSAQRLEQIVSAHRMRAPLPDSSEVVRALRDRQTIASGIRPKSEDPTDDAPQGKAPTPDRLDEALQRGLRIWRGTFHPSQDLDRRGVNINSVRARLGALGEILAANPIIESGGSMVFEFVLGLREPPSDLDSWQKDGIQLAPESSAVAASTPTSGATPAGASTLFIAPSHIVRVDLSRLDDLMRITGEMVIHRSRLEERIARAAGDHTALQETNLALGRSLRELREALTRVRLVSIAEIFTRMPFVVRDLARDTGKRVRLVLEGQNTEIDKYLVERLKEPLLHLVRNAISHGVELPEARAAAGKPEEATLVLRAEAVAHSVVIHVRDDGRGVDQNAVAARAAATGTPAPGELDAHELLDVLCVPGFSTREVADRASGRGVGMAVVQSTVRELGGTLALDTRPGVGTQFTIRLPLTLSIAETFIVSVGEHTCAVPQEFVHEVLPLAADRVDRIHGVEVAPYRDSVLPLVRLGALFNVAPLSASRPPAILVLNTERGLVGLVVDRVIGRREVVVRAMSDPLIQVPGVSGATELGDGRPVLILDPTALAGRIHRSATRRPASLSSAVVSAPA